MAPAVPLSSREVGVMAPAGPLRSRESDGVVSLVPSLPSDGVVHARPFAVTHSRCPRVCLPTGTERPGYHLPIATTHHAITGYPKSALRLGEGLGHRGALQDSQAVPSQH
jgi:hypothetical protein